MNDFYNGPPCPLWVAFLLTVFMMGLCVYAIRSIRLFPLTYDGTNHLSAVKALGVGFCALGLLWMPVWFVYGMLTLKFT